MTNEELILEIRKDNIKAKEILIEKNLPLIHYFIKKYYKIIPYELTKDDLMQAGIIGLIKALEVFDFNFKVKFITFAYRYVRGEILKTIDSCNQKSRPFSYYINSLNYNDDSQVSEELADYLKYNVFNSEKNVIEEEILDKIFLKEVMGLVTEKQRKILKYRYIENLTQVEIGKILGMHQVDVSREESKARRKILLVLKNRNCETL